MIDLNEMIAGCINFLMAWFLLVATCLAALCPTFFLGALWVDADFRRKWRARVLAAYGAVKNRVAP